VEGRTSTAKPKNITLKELSEHRVLVPPELAETGMSLVVLVGLDGRLQPGLVNSNDVPIAKPIQDLTRLQRARAIVSSLDVAASKSSTITEVKEQIISAAITQKIQPEKVELKIGAQSELIKCKTLSNVLTENVDLFKSCPHNKTAVYRSTALKWFDGSLCSINDYVLNTQCCNQSTDLNAFLLKYHVPKWFFNKFTVGKVQELATNSIDDVFFPRKLSRMITFSEKELLSDGFIAESVDFHNQLDNLSKIITCYPSKEKDAILYPMPNDFSRRFSTFVDLPQIDRTIHQSSILSLTLIHMVFCGIPLKALTVENLKLHQHSLIFEGEVPTVLTDKVKPDDFIESALQNQKPPEDFAYVKEMSTTPKVQYKDFINAEGMKKIIGFRFIDTFCNIFNITELERKMLGPGIIFDYKQEVSYSITSESIFRVYPPEIVHAQERNKYSTAFSLLKPTQPKELNFGNPNSPLTHDSEKFLRNLTNAKFHDVFLSNVRKYLQSFNNASFQAQAVKIMHATLQARVVTLSEPPDDTSTSDVDDSTNPYTDLS
jgi:hypothetical protein